MQPILNGVVVNVLPIIMYNETISHYNGIELNLIWVGGRAKIISCYPSLFMPYLSIFMLTIRTSTTYLKQIVLCICYLSVSVVIYKQSPLLGYRFGATISLNDNFFSFKRQNIVVKCVLYKHYLPYNTFIIIHIHLHM